MVRLLTFQRVEDLEGSWTGPERKTGDRDSTSEKNTQPSQNGGRRYEKRGVDRGWKKDSCSTDDDQFVCMAAVVVEFDLTMYHPVLVFTSSDPVDH